MATFRVLAAWLLTAGLVAAAGAQPTKEAAAELKVLEGTWKVVSGEFSGKAMSAKEVGLDEVVVTGGRLTLKVGGKEVASYRITIDPGKKPKAMDWLNEKEKALLPTIYELDGGKLRLCFPLLRAKGSDVKVEVKRPEGFETKDKPLGLLVAEREKKP